jgi:DNA helicase-2/ATP-dependent DNA helicase PcrA
MSLLDQLNPAQCDAATATEGPVLILAGPGSGKTRVIVHRVAHLVENVGIAPYNILAVTFTNKAAREMRERLTPLLGESRTRWLTVGTFHATCARWLRIDGAAIGVDPRFVIVDDGDSLDIIKAAVKEHELDSQRASPRSILSAISLAKTDLLSAAEYARRANTYWENTVARIYATYQRRLDENSALDFDDLLVKAVMLFRDCPDVLACYHDRYKHVLVDEFQDTNVTQYELVRLLGKGHGNVCVVGDEDQSIYGWRKADVRNIKRFEEDFPTRRVILLEQNYRSTQTILDVATGVIGRNEERKPKRLWTENPRGEPVVIHLAYNEQDEAQWVVRQIEALRRGGGGYRDVAITYRTNAQSRAMEDAMVRYGLPYRLIGGTRFYQRREVKDLLAYLRLAQNPDDSLSLARVINVPTRGIGAKTVEQLTRWANSQELSLFAAAKRAAIDHETPPLATRSRARLGELVALIEDVRARAATEPVSALLDAVIERTRYQQYLCDGTTEGDERWENVGELRQKTHDFDSLAPGDGLGALLEEVALVQDVDSLDENQSDAATLITLHAAKGLEFPYVFIIGVEEGLCPHIRSMDSPDQMAEERRLLYVGITRAMKRLFLAHASQRGPMGGGGPSRFFADIPMHLVEATAGSQAQPRDNRWSASSTREFSDASRLAVAWRNPSLRRREAAWQPEPDDLDLGIGVERTPTPVVRRPAVTSTAARAFTFARGTRVRHTEYGEGEVLVSSFAAGDELVLVKFDVRPDKPKNLSLAIHRLDRA